MEFTLAERLAAIEALRQEMISVAQAPHHPLLGRAQAENPWFFEPFIRQALANLIALIEPVALATWVRSYEPLPTAPKNVAVVMAGNVPMVGFHDALCVLLAGHHLQARLSSQDKVLMTWLLSFLKNETPVFTQAIEITERIHAPDAVIATGSDNSSRYFDYYFGKYPHIIRRNRTSLAIITGQETEEEMEGLAHDLFLYAGHGCRNVGKLLVPRGYDFAPVVQAANKLYGWLLDHSKYANNYDYQKAVAVINLIPLVDAHFFVMRESADLVAPTGAVFFSYYDSPEEVQTYLEMYKDKLQVVIGRGHEAFGGAQCPSLTDYADGVDIMAWLKEL